MYWIHTVYRHVHAVVVPALIAVNVVTMLTVLSILAIILTCYLLKKYKISKLRQYN